MSTVFERPLRLLADVDDPPLMFDEFDPGPRPLLASVIFGALLQATPGTLRLGSGHRAAKGPPPQATAKRAAVKAARKANRRRRK